MSTLLIGVAIGLVIGLLVGWILGRGTTGSAPADQPTATAASADPNTLRLRERSWRDGAGGLCTGVFEVVTAPPSLTGLRFSVMDAEGKVIGKDKVSTDRRIKPGTMLELGFDTGKCARIKKWDVQVEER